MAGTLPAHMGRAVRRLGRLFAQAAGSGRKFGYRLKAEAGIDPCPRAQGHGGRRQRLAGISIGGQSIRGGNTSEQNDPQSRRQYPYSGAGFPGSAQAGLPSLHRRRNAQALVGPRGWELTASRMDFRPGGSWHYCMKCMDQAQGDFFGMESWGKTVYEEVVDGEKFTGTDYFSDAEGIENRDMPPARIMLLFEDVEGGTKVTNHSVYASAEALKSVIDMGMEQGVTETWDRLEEYVAAAAKA
ncbi:hypothetical protein BN871_HX_00140 [Paenibacillus sp. P22]|nr:hypothetical protein BN871_HX_00140 [Paenibacillus sp. P22]